MLKKTIEIPSLCEQASSGLAIRPVGKCCIPMHGVEGHCGGETRKRPALSVFMLQTPSVAQSCKHQPFTLPPASKICFMLSLNRRLMSYWSLSACWSCSMQTQMRKRTKSIWIPGCSAVPSLLDYLFLLSLLNCGRTALCPNFEQGTCGRRSTSKGRPLCCSTGKSGAAPLWDHTA